MLKTTAGDKDAGKDITEAKLSVQLVPPGGKPRLSTTTSGKDGGVGVKTGLGIAKAQTAQVSLQRREGLICLEVSDDGSGFIAKKMNKLGLGLHHIDARARKLGGTVQMSSTPNLGTRIVVQFGRELIGSKAR